MRKTMGITLDRLDSMDADLGDVSGMDMMSSGADSKYFIETLPHPEQLVRGEDFGGREKERT
jgi:hypothetical protein